MVRKNQLPVFTLEVHVALGTSLDNLVRHDHLASSASLAIYLKKII